MDADVQRFVARPGFNPRSFITSLAALVDDFFSGTLSESLDVLALREVAISSLGIDALKSSIDKLLNCIYADRRQLDFAKFILEGHPPSAQASPASF